jgi:hypothetical protein
MRVSKNEMAVSGADNNCTKVRFILEGQAENG